jgi:hypothetical protein
MQVLVKNNISTSVANAYKIQFGYSFFNVSFEKVDPNYRTLGAYYVNNNFYNFTVNASKQFKKIALSGRFGIEQHSTQEYNMSSNKQIVASANVTYNPSKSTFISGNYSNFQTYSYIRNYVSESEIIDPYTYIDTLAYSCVNRSADLSFMHLLKFAKSKGNINLFASMQQLGFGSYIFMGNTMLTISKRSSYNYGVSIRSNYQTASKTAAIGAGGFIGNSFYKKKIMWRVSLNQNNYFTNEKFVRMALTMRGNMSYKIDKHQNLQVQMSNQISKKYNFMFNIGYIYNFNH